MKENITTPILFFVFNRPEKTKQVFEVIRKVQPTKLYVACDGPRTNNHIDKINTEKVKDIVTKIDWNCEAKFLFHEKNLGCSLAGKTAWQWIFSYEEEMICLEDDGLPSVSFFWFCQELLKKYRNDPKIAVISGVNYGMTYGKASYFFTTVGGASYAMGMWKRFFDLYEYNLDSYRSIRNTKKFKENFISPFMYKYWIQKFDKYISDGINTYALQTVFVARKFNMVSITPNINLCSNIGFDFDGSNTSVDPNSELAQQFGNRPRFEINEIIHPAEVSINKAFELAYFKKRFLRGKSLILYLIRYQISNIVRKLCKTK